MSLKGKFKNFWMLLKTTFKEWNEREPFNNAIIIAYYTIFSLPGLLVIIINIAGAVFGHEAVTNQVASQISGAVGSDTAKDVQEMVANASKSSETTLSTILSVATLLFGATGVVYQLQQILNKLWGVKPKPKGKIAKLVKDRFLSFGLILVIGFFLLVSLVLSAAVTSVSDWMSSYLPDGLVVLFSILDILLSIAIITLLFAAIFKFLPDAKIRWKDVWAGAALTAVLFVIAKFLLGLYFGKTDPGSTYGAAGTIILIMLWVTYSGMILLFGAEFTKVYADEYGHKIVPTKGATLVDEDDDNGAIVNKKPAKKTNRYRSRPDNNEGGRDRGERSKSPDKEKSHKKSSTDGDTFHYEAPM